MDLDHGQRLHYCPIKGCSRSEGGNGFKRENEMIRHRLVHSSRGYMCPFCNNPEHKYPRPDNLQRYSCSSCNSLVFLISGFQQTCARLPSRSKQERSPSTSNPRSATGRQQKTSPPVPGRAIIHHERLYRA